MKKIFILLLTILTISSVAQAATKAVVPRADTEGSIGTTSKRWGAGYYSGVVQSSTGFKFQNGQILAAPTLSGLSDVGSATISSGRILVADGTNYQSVLINGDCFLTSNGRLSCTSYAKQLTGLSDVGSATIAAGRLLISDGTKYQSVTMSGECLITSSGVIDCASQQNATQLTGLSDVGSATITAGRLLIANGTQFQSVAMSGECLINSAGVIDCASQQNGATQLTGLSDVGSSTVGAGRLLINDGTKFQSLLMSGQCSLNVSGTIDCGQKITGATQLTGLTDIGSSTATAGRLFIADGTKFQSTAMSGTCTLTSAGVIACTRDTPIFVVSSPVSSTSFPLMKYTSGATINACECLVDSGTSAGFTLKQCNGNGGACGNITTLATCGTTSTTMPIAAGGITGGNDLKGTIGTVTGTVNNLRVTCNQTQ